MTDSRVRRRFQHLVTTAASRAKEAVASQPQPQPTATAPPPVEARPGIRKRIEIAALNEGFEAAERVIYAYEAELWARLARVAEPIDRSRALDYAQRAVQLDPNPDHLQRFVRLTSSMGILRSTERLLAEALAKADLPPGPFHRQLQWLRVWRGFLDDGFPIPERRSRREIVPRPDTVMYLMHNSLPHDNSGYATRSHGVLTSLQNAGQNVLAFTRFGYPWDSARRKKLEFIPDYPEQDEVDGITYHRLRTLERGWGQVPLDQYMHGAADELERVIRIERPSIIHAASNFMVGLPSIVAARRLGLPVVYEVRGMWEVTRVSRDPEWQGSEHHETYVRLETLAASEADAVITLTEALKEELVRRGVPAERITVVPNSVDSGQFVVEPRDRELERQLGLEGKRVIGYVGSFVQYEGLDDLLYAASVVLDRGVDLRLLLVGDGDQLPRLRKLVAELELEDQVILTGRVPFADVQRYYSLIDVAVFPRKPLPVTEMVSPMKPFEAMATEKAVLVSSVRALEEIVADGETGMVFQKGDIDNLAGVLEVMVSDPELCARLGKNAREWVVANRSWDRAADKIVEVYRAVGAGNELPELTQVPGIPADVWQRLHARNERARQKAILSYSWTGRVLDVGSGRGFVSCLIALAHQPAELVGVEPNQRYLEQSRALAEANGVQSFSAVTGRGEDLPAEPASFDRVLISEVLEHTREPVELLREAARVLAPGGTVLVTVPRHGAMPPGTVAGHVQDFTVEELQTLLKDAGLHPLEHRTVASWEFYLAERAAPADLIENALERLSRLAAEQGQDAR
jgi:PEP-CTERM/exosortase A-associated glycosyltransferase